MFAKQLNRALLHRKVQARKVSPCDAKLARIVAEDERDMGVRVGDRVFVAGQAGEFMVMRLDHERQCADLMTTVGIRRIQEGVSLAALRRTDDPDQNLFRPSSEPQSAN